MSGEDGIDVARLAEAIHVVGLIQADDPYFLETVGEIAEEYDRLAEEQTR